ncbi:uncharacterized protein SPSK_04741 [Sporothrix schenckii 1099-18]|uniref:Uncharacterized protein n=1 Tax=Sporothrix schenckii 1099-18 TaxID=1397361 RepID=A0A0F2M1A9_SPOSC|nr:uncharacterized protein SPSK_04741 [Sporothrix schenckii 1099-18]KJR83487.1 hypothetical protein SPSK_04741 [Sporothrix schenckii 1099-18]
MVVVGRGGQVYVQADRKMGSKIQGQCQQGERLWGSLWPAKEKMSASTGRLGVVAAQRRTRVAVVPVDERREFALMERTAAGGG